MIAYIFNTLACIGFNLVNSRIDAYKIRVLHKEVRHGVNLAAYLTLVGFLIIHQRPESWAEVWQQVVFLVSALANRQISFDVPLNRRRHLPWYYQSTAEPPRALWDRLERWVFGNIGGKAIAGVYAGAWIICTGVRVFI